jgi:hypothetical protein
MEPSAEILATLHRQHVGGVTFFRALNSEVYRSRGSVPGAVHSPLNVTDEGGDLTKKAYN